MIEYGEKSSPAPDCFPDGSALARVRKKPSQQMPRFSLTRVRKKISRSRTMVPDSGLTRHLQRILAAGPAGRHESTALATVDIGTLPHADDVLARVQRTMSRMRENEMGDPAEFDRALTILYREAEQALRKLQ